MSLMIGKDVPWNASWSGEDKHEVRPCHHADGKLAVWSPHKPGEGRPIFAKPHMVRQRKSIAEMCCTVCGEKTEVGNRWWFPRGEWRDGYWMSTESPVHLKCAELAQHACPVLRKDGRPPIRFPETGSVVASILGGDAFERDFNIRTNGRTVIGHLKFAWRNPAFLLQDPIGNRVE